MAATDFGQSSDYANLLMDIKFYENLIATPHHERFLSWAIEEEELTRRLNTRLAHVKALYKEKYGIDYVNSN
jgi:hypothetical protein